MNTKLHVGNLSFNSTESALRSMFEADGRKVEEITVVADRETGQPRGFAFVQMTTPEDAKAAIAALNGRDLDGRSLTVAEARAKVGGAGGAGRR